MDTETLIQLLETGGLVAALAVAIVAMMRGWIWPKHMVDRVIDEQRKASEATAERIANQMENGLRHAVKEGILEARGISGNTNPGDVD